MANQEKPDSFDKCVHNLKNMEWRPTWNEYFMSVAYLISKRSSCVRLHVGCVIVKDNHIVTTGYNGHLAGADHNTFIRDGHEMLTIHAEMNAVSDSAKRGVALQGCIVYVTHIPCINCIKVLLSAGIVKVIYAEHYKDDQCVETLCKSGNVELCKFSVDQYQQQ